MIANARIPLHRLVLSLSDALDFANREIADHQQRVAYISILTARQMGIKGDELLDIFLAAALHDIGLITVEDKMLALDYDQLERVSWHADAGYDLLREHPLFSRPAEAIRYHHVLWADGRGAEGNGRPVPLASHIIALADSVERSIDRGAFVLDQAPVIRAYVKEHAGSMFHPDCAEAFQEAARSEAFWLDCVCERIFGLLLGLIDWPVMKVDIDGMVSIAEIFGRIVDAMSSWTATHSAGTSASCVALAERVGFSPRELAMMRVAGYLHDLGKLAVPNAILDKPGALTKREMAVIRSHTYHTFRILETVGGLPVINQWASFHHERLDGQGYPFHHGDEDLILGARIMAVADMFTAMSEDRPYRKVLPRDRIISILKKQVAGGGLDGRIVDLLVRDYDAIHTTRWKEQAIYMEKQKRLAAVMDRLEPTPVGTVS